MNDRIDNISEKIRKARREIELSQQDLADKINVSVITITRWESGKTDRVGLVELRKIAQATGKPLQYFITEEESDNYLREALKGSNFIPLEKSEPEPPLVAWADLYKMDKKSVFNGEGENSMLRVNVGDSDNDPEFSGTDILWFIPDSSIQDKKYYLLKDFKHKVVILRQLRKYGTKIVLSTKNFKFEDEFDGKRFEIIGRVTKHEREL